MTGVEVIARRAVERTAARLAAALADALPTAVVRNDGDRITVTGRGAGDPAWRWPASVLR